MQQTGEQPLVVALSSLGVGESRYQVPFYWRWPLSMVLMFAFADHKRQETILRESNLPYVILRPTFMEDEPPTGHIKPAAPPQRVKTSASVTKADVATFALDAIEQRHFDCQAVALTA